MRPLAALSQLADVVRDAQPGEPIKAFNVAVSKLRPDPEQPRKTFGGPEDEAFVGHLRETRKIVEPLLVRPVPDEPGEFFIIAGERRWRCALEAGLTEVPVLLADDLDPVTILELQLVENYQRRDLEPLETARALQRLIEVSGWSQVAVGVRLGMSPTKVSQYLALLRTSSTTQKALEEGVLNDRDAARVFDKLPEATKVQALEQGRRTGRALSRDVLLDLTAASPAPVPVPLPAERPSRPTRGASPAAQPAAPEPPRRGRGRPAIERPRRIQLPPLTPEQLGILLSRLGLPVPSPDQPFDPDQFLAALSQ